MNTSKKGPLIDGGTCRCCGVTKKCRLLNVEYEFCGQKEIYFEMFVDCFGLVLSHLEGEEKERLICATCVMRLRDACAFRQQVLQWEEKLLQLQMQVQDDDNSTKQSSKIDIKIELEDSPDMDNDSDMPESELIAPNPANSERDRLLIKKEDGTKEEIMSVKKKLVRRSIINRNSIAETRAKREMQMKLKAMREKLVLLRRKRKVVKSIVPTQRIDKLEAARRKSFHNIVILVENSYVCPFYNTFNNYNCIYCEELFTDPEELRDHTNTHDPRTYKKIEYYKEDLQIDIARIDCRLCPASIDNLDTFYKHITNVHDKKLFPNIRNEFLRFNLKCGTFSCFECNGSFTHFSTLKNHMAVHFGTCICDVCGEHFFDEGKLYNHQRIHEDKNDTLFPCEVCGKFFKTKRKIKEHIARFHTNKPVYDCSRCSDVFPTQISRHKHMVEIHGDLTKKFICESCDKVYDKKKSFNEHNRKSHLKILNHECVVCGKKFYLPVTLRIHMTKHTGIRDYKCEYCGHTFARLSNLKLHLRRIHTEEKVEQNKENKK